MAVDLALWLILAGIIALVVCGCIYTVPVKKPLKLHDGEYNEKMNHAA